MRTKPVISADELYFYLVSLKGLMC